MVADEADVRVVAGLVESEKRGLWIYYRLREDLPPSTIRLNPITIIEGHGITDANGTAWDLAGSADRVFGPVGQ